MPCLRVRKPPPSRNKTKKKYLFGDNDYDAQDDDGYDGLDDADGDDGGGDDDDDDQGGDLKAGGQISIIGAP